MSISPHIHKLLADECVADVRRAVRERQQPKPTRRRLIATQREPKVRRRLTTAKEAER
jgi:hypothetical protein